MKKDKLFAGVSVISLQWKLNRWKSVCRYWLFLWCVVCAPGNLPTPSVLFVQKPPPSWVKNLLKGWTPAYYTSLLPRWPLRDSSATVGGNGNRPYCRMSNQHKFGWNTDDTDLNGFTQVWLILFLTRMYLQHMLLQHKVVWNTDDKDLNGCSQILFLTLMQLKYLLLQHKLLWNTDDTDLNRCTQIWRFYSLSVCKCNICFFSTCLDGTRMTRINIDSHWFIAIPDKSHPCLSVSSMSSVFYN